MKINLMFLKTSMLAASVYDITKETKDKKDKIYFSPEEIKLDLRNLIERASWNVCVANSKRSLCCLEWWILTTTAANFHVTVISWSSIHQYGIPLPSAKYLMGETEGSSSNNDWRFEVTPRTLRHTQLQQVFVGSTWQYIFIVSCSW